jgi:bifunctional non-homologous end joining protein LigD
MLQRNGPVAGLVEPCLPSSAKVPPSGPDWLHEIKHDGFRILARREAKGVRLYIRNGHDFTKRFPLVWWRSRRCRCVLALSTATPSSRTSPGSRCSNLMRRRRSGLQPVLCAFDLLELDDEEVRRLPIEERKRILANLTSRIGGRF